MPINLQCSTCGRRAQVPDSAAGKVIKCACGATFTAPSFEPLALSPAAPAKSPMDVMRDEIQARQKAGPSWGDRLGRLFDVALASITLITKAIVVLLVIGAVAIGGWYYKHHLDAEEARKVRAEQARREREAQKAQEAEANKPAEVPTKKQSASEIQEIARKMYRQSDGRIKESDAALIATAVIEEHGKDRGIEILDSIVKYARFSQASDLVIKSISAGDPEETSTWLRADEDHVTNIQWEDCFKGAVAVQKSKSKNR